jgi:4-amino-4-deoxy-L-arabinose transferase-like glycosyltransferase
MIKKEQHRLVLSALILIGACTIARMFYAQSFLLTPDEANYWQWSRHLAWGYHDQTPMIAWAIRLFTAILGPTELAVRLPSIVAMAIASIYLVLMARHWFSDRVAWQTALLAQSVFIFNIGALLATADGIQGAAWAAASYHTARGFEHNQWRHWLSGGLWFGFGMLSKYTMVLFLPFVFSFGLLAPFCRPRLRTLRPYLGCALGVIMFLPVVWWNADNHWNSFRHVAYLGGANEGFALHWRYLGEYIGSQIGLLTPMVFGVITAGWVWVFRHRSSPDRWIYPFLLSTSLPMIAVFALLSLHTRVYGNWPCAGYLTACVLAAALWSAGPGKSGEAAQNPKSRRLWRWTWGSAFFLTALVLVHVHWRLLPIAAQNDRTIYEIRGWDALGKKVAKIRQAMPVPDNSFIFGMRYQLASELAFYVPGRPFTVSINRWDRPNVYDYWWTDEELMGKDAVGVTRHMNSRQRLLQVFARVDAPEPFMVYPPGAAENRLASPVRTLYIYRCYDFKGGLRWIPPRGDDIRAEGGL